MAKCQLCGKGSQVGNNVSHSKRRTKTRWLPNIHQATVIVDGAARRMKVCTRCLRSQHKVA